MDLENRSIGINGEATLAAAYHVLKEHWKAGERDRELGLHLCFLAWYGLIEPMHLTGFEESEETRLDLNLTLSEVHAYFQPQISEDPEIVVGLAADMFWFMFDNSKEWEQRGIDYKYAYRRLVPNGLDREIFHNRGAYGDYYAGHAQLEGGY